MKFIFTTIISYCLIITSAFAKAPPTTKGSYRSSILINSFVKHYSKRVERDINKYNKVRKNPQSFLQLLPKEDQTEFLNLLKHYKIKELPQLKKYNDHYQADIGKHKITFDLVSTFNHSIYIDGKKFTFSKNRVLKNLPELEKFIQSNLVKSTSISLPFINDAHAWLPLIFGGLAAVGLASAYVAKSWGDDRKEVLEQFNEIQKDIENLNRQCRNDLPQAGRPEEAQETLRLLKLFIDNNSLQEDKLKKHFYKTLVGDNEKYETIKEADPVDCKKFIDILKGKKNITDLNDMKYNGRICPPHEELKSCIRTFYEKFISENGNRSIDEFIYGTYEPESNIFNNTKDK